MAAAADGLLSEVRDHQQPMAGDAVLVAAGSLHHIRWFHVLRNAKLRRVQGRRRRNHRAAVEASEEFGEPRGINGSRSEREVLHRPRPLHVRKFQHCVRHHHLCYTVQEGQQELRVHAPERGQHTRGSRRGLRPDFLHERDPQSFDGLGGDWPLLRARCGGFGDSFSPSADRAGEDVQRRESHSLDIGTFHISSAFGGID
mmetsp:Transcript_9513/g.25957  ORF Transcript_9513/g.25957 Transcript_9513/m.25957 type:complete len:200 (+) Transcript_9513:111-710(+)